MARHQQRRVLRAVVRRERLHRRGHHGCHRRVQRHLRQRHLGQHVVPGEDALGGALRIGHDDRTYAPPAHLRQRFPQAGARCTGHRRMGGQFAQPGPQGLFSQHFGGMRVAHGQPRQFQVLADTAVEEFGKGRTARGQLLHGSDRQFEGEGIPAGGVSGCHRALPHGGRQRKEVTRLVVGGAAGEFGLALAPRHRALADEKDRLHLAVFRPLHHLAGRVVALDAAREEEVDVVRRHLRERRMAGQFSAQCRQQSGRGRQRRVRSAVGHDELWAATRAIETKKSPAGSPAGLC